MIDLNISYNRFELIRITHWSYTEMRDAFGYSLDQYIYFGGYLGPAAMISNEKRWKKYIKDSLVAPAIEVKSGRRKMNSGLPKFTDAFHPTRSFVVGTGGIPIETFLSCDIEDLIH